MSDDDDEYYRYAMAASHRDEDSNAPFTSKRPPDFDGSKSFFTYEDQVRDWVDMTQFSAEKQGPQLLSKIIGPALIHKALVDRAKLKAADGVEYLLEFLRPKYISGKTPVFLHRFFKLLKLTRGSQDFRTWTTKFTIARLYCSNAWEDLIEIPTVESEESLAWRRHQNQESSDAADIMTAQNQRERATHATQAPALLLEST